MSGHKIAFCALLVHVMPNWYKGKTMFRFQNGQQYRKVNDDSIFTILSVSGDKIFLIYNCNGHIRKVSYPVHVIVHGLRDGNIEPI